MVFGVDKPVVTAAGVVVTAPDVFGDADSYYKSIAESLCIWANCLVGIESYKVYKHVLVQLLPRLLVATGSDSNTLSQTAKLITLKAAWVQVPEEDVDSVLGAVMSVVNHKSWQVRQSALSFVWTFLPRHFVVLSVSTRKAAQKQLLSSLRDEVVTVRLTAYEALCALLRSCSHDELELCRPKLQKRFRKWANTSPATSPTPNKDEEAKDDDGPDVSEKKAKGLTLRHAGVLGSMAFVKLFPYSVPDWLPSHLADLSSHLSDPSPIREGVKKVFLDFHKTHQDQWHEFKEKFTEEELDAVRSISMAPSYFV